MFGLLMTIIIGFIVGVIAKLIMPGKENMGFIVTTLLGIAGSIVATYTGQAIGWYEAGEGAGWIGSIVGAFLLLWIYLKFKSGSAPASA
jgi:uncharacterized membrane protein YeaQ/YmgE (transglycosylase-associated protein family)